jgi:hypothetical protein
MGTRGRKSAAEMGIIHGLPQRPDAPAELTPEQAREWREIVTRLPVDWFSREVWPLLCAYCRHIINARHIAGLIEEARSADLNDRPALMKLKRLLSMQERQSSALMGLATRMRITNQSRYTAKSAATAARTGSGGPKPWEE